MLCQAPPAAVAQDGNTVTIAPGTYYDCALWHASGLTIVGTGPDVEITDSACAGKAAFVIEGNDVVVRGLSFWPHPGDGRERGRDAGPGPRSDRQGHSFCEQPDRVLASRPGRRAAD